MVSDKDTINQMQKCRKFFRETTQFLYLNMAIENEWEEKSCSKLRNLKAVSIKAMYGYHLEPHLNKLTVKMHLWNDSETMDTKIVLGYYQRITVNFVG